MMIEVEDMDVIRKNRKKKKLNEKEYLFDFNIT